MEGRIHSIFLKYYVATLLLVAGLLISNSSLAQDIVNEELKPVIEPSIERKELDESKLDTEDFEFTAFIGFISIEDFGSNTVYGARFAYHITETLFVEGTIGQSKGGETSYETLSGPPALYTDEDRVYTYYNASIGFNLLPGEAFLTDQTTFNTDLYIIGGVGSTNFLSEDRYTINYGVGYRVAMTDYLAMHLDFRDHIFSTDAFGEDKLAHNLELSLGLSFFF